MGLYLKHFILFVTDEQAPKARVFHYNGLERRAMNKHSSLLGPYESNAENKALRIWLQGTYSQHFIFS